MKFKHGDMVEVEGYLGEVIKVTESYIEVLLDGIKTPYVIFCDTNKGYLIKHKQAVDGNLIVENGALIYEIRIGKVEVVKDGLDKQTE